MGKLIIFEGLDGSGKGTQTKLTADRLRQRGALAPVIVELFAAAAVAHARVGRSFADHHMVLPVMALYRLR